MASNDKAAFLVSLAGPAIDFFELMRSQRRNMLVGEGLSEAQERRSEPVYISILQALAASKTPEEGRAAALALLTPEAKAALGVPREIDGTLVLRDLIRARVWYLAHYDPAPNIQRIKVPVLVLNGSLDRQTEAGQNLAAWREGLKGNPDATIVELPGLNHMFQHATTGGRGEYRDIEETFAPEALDLIGKWIGERFEARRNGRSSGNAPTESR
jgi:pimeloyl-ACP methyl ester carboxylesterase